MNRQAEGKDLCSENRKAVAGTLWKKESCCDLVPLEQD